MFAGILTEWTNNDDNSEYWTHTATASSFLLSIEVSDKKQLQPSSDLNIHIEIGRNRSASN